MITKFKLLEQPMSKIKIKDFVTFQSSKNKQFYFHIRGHNNKIVIASEGYKTKQSRTSTIKAINSSLAYLVPVLERSLVVRVPKPAKAKVSRS